ncbi:MAG: hypothetical protein HUJ68_05630, partial [Clostridia bacterium]|nr:hypothetical protein [Clostridia bacterium]
MFLFPISIINFDSGLLKLVSSGKPPCLNSRSLSISLIELSLEIIKNYCKVIFEKNRYLNKFNKWILNDNIELKNIFEIGVEEIHNPKKSIYFFKNLFDFLEKNDDKNVFYNLLKDREDNIFHLSVKQENIFIFLYLYERIKKYYPSENPLNIVNKRGYSPLHYSCLYSNKEIT